MYYTREFIIKIIKYSEHIQSVKEKTTRTLIPNNYKENDNFDPMGEGNTLKQKGFGGSRIPKNTNDIIEVLSCITADIDLALDTLEPEERMAVFLKFGPYNTTATPQLSELAEAGLLKMVDYLNGGHFNLYY